MDIATLGVNIDPTEAVRGAEKATQAAFKMGASFDKVVASWQAGQRLLDNTFKAMVSGIDRLAAAAMRSTGVIGDAFGLMVRSAAFAGGALYNVVERTAKVFGMLGSAARAAGSAVGQGLGMAANAVRGVMNSITGSVSGIVNAFAQVGLAIQGFKSVTSPITGFVSSTIDSASRMEGFENRWAFLLGSFDKAKSKMAELQQFANVTPFDLPGVTEAALAVNRLTDATFKGQDALRKIGDAAAIAQQPIEEVAQRIVRLSGNLQRGAGGGDELRALTEWGIIAPATSAKIQEMSTDAGNFKEAIALVAKELDKTKGAMGLMAETWDGKVSTMGDSWNTFKTAIGEPIIQGLKPLISDMTGLIDGFTAQIKLMAPQIKEVTLLIPAAFRVMQQEGGLKLAFTAAVDTLKAMLSRLWETTRIVLLSVFEYIGYRFTQMMKVVASPEFWKGVGEALAAGVKNALNVLKQTDTGSFWQDFWKKATTGQTDAGRVIQKYDTDRARLEGRRDSVLRNPELPGAVEELNELNKNIQKLNQNVEYDLPEYAKGGGVRPGGAGSLFDVTGEGAPSVVSPGEAWASTAREMTDAQREFVNETLDALGIIKKESAETQDANNLLLGNAKDQRDAAAADAAARGHSATKKEAAASARADSKLDAMAQGYLDRDPVEKYQRELEELKKLRDAHKITEEQYRTQVAKTTEEHAIAMKRRKEESVKAAEAEMTALQKLAREWGNLKKNTETATAAMAQAMADSIAGGLTDMITGAKSASQAFADMAKSMVNSIVSIITKLWVQYMLSKLLGMAGGGAGGGAGFLGFAGKAVAGGVFHDGGIVGDGFGGSGRMVSASAFTSAKRYHEGGLAGLRSGEVPAILERGEMVIPARETASARKRALTGGGNAPAAAPNVTVLNFVDKAQLMAAAAENPDAIMNVISMRKDQLRAMVQKG